MAKKQTRRSVSLNRGTYERLRAYCETNGISMSQFVETRIGEVLGVPAQAISQMAERARAEGTASGQGSQTKEAAPPTNRSGGIFTF